MKPVTYLIVQNNGPLFENHYKKVIDSLIFYYLGLQQQDSMINKAYSKNLITVNLQY